MYKNRRNKAVLTKRDQEIGDIRDNRRRKTRRSSYRIHRATDVSVCRSKVRSLELIIRELYRKYYRADWKHQYRSITVINAITETRERIAKGIA